MIEDNFFLRILLSIVEPLTIRNENITNCQLIKLERVFIKGLYLKKLHFEMILNSI